jgi:hypothetical protein
MHRENRKMRGNTYLANTNKTFSHSTIERIRQVVCLAYDIVDQISLAS